MRNKQVKVLMYEHGGNRNRGCEAIVRSTCGLLRRVFTECEATVISHDPQNDSRTCIPGVREFIWREGFRQWTPAWFVSGIWKRLGIDKVVVPPNYLERAVNRCDLCMSIGGDMYCYKEYPPSYLMAVDRMAKRAAKPLVLWGASIEGNLITDEIRTDLESFDLISVRESITYETLDELGVNRNLHQFPDPAFTMQREEVVLPQNWTVGNSVGINISPLIMQYESTPGLLMKVVIDLIKHILANMDCSVALIPHVFINGFNDMDPLQEVYWYFKDTGRVVLVGEHHSAPALKAFISHCRFFIGARTHAMIAAYSSQVPTLALGYSVKARGIARDIFGDEKGLVLPIQDLSSARQLIDAFDELREREGDLRRRLEEMMPGYVNHAHLAIEEVRALF